MCVRQWGSLVVSVCGLAIRYVEPIKGHQGWKDDNQGKDVVLDVTLVNSVGFHGLPSSRRRVHRPAAIFSCAVVLSVSIHQVMLNFMIL